MGEKSYLIELFGQGFLAVQKVSHQNNFHWDEYASAALRFQTEDSAKDCMNAVRQLRPELFPVHLPKGWGVTEHVWL